MPLYRKQKPKIYKTDDVLVGNTNSPLAFKQPVPERNIDFENAKPTPSDNAFVIAALELVQSQPTIVGSNLPSINNESTTERYIKPIFLGSPGNPTDEFLYANPSSTLNFVTNSECEKVFLFANMQAKKSSRGFNKISDKKDLNIPNTITTKLPSDTTSKYQLMFLEQTDNDSKIKLNAYDLVVENVGKGIGTVIQSPIQLDTWYNKNPSAPTGRNGRWVDYNMGDNVTVGATNDTLVTRQIGERYNWSFGSIFLVKSFGSTTRNPNETYREIKYVFENGKITLHDWDYVIADSPTTYTDRYTTKVKLIDEISPIVDTENLTKEEVTNGVVGRKIFTYLIRAFEEGECIRIEEVYGGIRINVDFNYNGRACEKFVSTSSSSSYAECFALLPGYINEYEVTDGKICVQFEGEDNQVGYIKICGDDIPVSTVDGFLVWNYGTVDAVTIDVFNSCQGFYTTSGCYYEICFTGYPIIRFTVQVLSKSSSSTSSVSYSSSSSSSSSSSMGTSSSSSSYALNHFSSSSQSTSSSSKSTSSSSSSPSSQSRSSSSSDSSKQSSSSTSFSSKSTSSSSSSSSSSNGTSSSSSSSQSSSSSSAPLSSQSDSSLSFASSPSSSSSSRSSNSSSSQSKSSQSSRSGFGSSDSSLSSQSSNVDLDMGIVYPTGAYKMYDMKPLYSKIINGYDTGIVVGNIYGNIGNTYLENAFTFTYAGDVINYISNLEESNSYAYSVDAMYYSTYDANLVAMGGNFAVQTTDASGYAVILNSPIYITDETFAGHFTLNVDDDNNPFENVTFSTSVYASCVRLIDNLIYICGPITYNSHTGFHGFPIQSIDAQNQVITCTASGAVYNYDVGVGGGAIRDLIKHVDFATTSELWAVGDFTTPTKGIMLIGANSLSAFPYELILTTGTTAGKGYSIMELDIQNQDHSSVSESSNSSSSKSSNSSFSISDQSASSNSSSSSSKSLSESSLSDFSSLSSKSSFSSDSSSSSNSSSSSKSSKSTSSSSNSDYSFGYTPKILVVAGNFRNVKNTTTSTLSARYNLAFFSSDGTLLNYRIIKSINGAIRKTLYDYDTNILYLAGEFTSIQDTNNVTYSPNYIIAFRIDPLNDHYTHVPLNVTPDNIVHNMIMIDRKIFICGEFQGMNSKYRPGIGAFNRFNFKVY